MTVTCSVISILKCILISIAISITEMCGQFVLNFDCLEYFNFNFNFNMACISIISISISILKTRLFGHFHSGASIPPSELGAIPPLFSLNFPPRGSCHAAFEFFFPDFHTAADFSFPQAPCFSLGTSCGPTEYRDRRPCFHNFIYSFMTNRLMVRNLMFVKLQLVFNEVQSLHHDIY